MHVCSGNLMLELSNTFFFTYMFYKMYSESFKQISKNMTKAIYVKDYILHLMLQTSEMLDKSLEGDYKTRKNNNNNKCQ